MEKDSRENLEKRVRRLEKEVEDLKSLLQVQNSADSVTLSSEADKVTLKESSSEPQKEQVQETSFTDKIQLGENWLQRIGIGLLLLGVAFLFKYSIDQGWLVPPIRSLIGLGIGLSLFITGLQLSEGNSTLKQICLGGGIAVFYITGFATFQLYSFAPASVVWIFMVVVTLLALSLSLQQNQPVLSVIGTLGGLGTPFMLYSGSGSLPALMIYTTVILSGASAMYLVKGWKSLLWTMATGSLLVMLVGFYNNILDVTEPVFSDRLSLQAGLLICLTVLWGIPVIREVLTGRDPRKWPDPAFQNKDGTVDDYASYLSNPTVQLMALVIPILGFLYSMGLWDITAEAWGVIAMAFALAIGYVYLPLRNEQLTKLASIHGFSALILLTISFFLLLEGELLFIVLALEGLGLRFIASKNEDEEISVSSHLLFGIIAVWMLNEFTTYNQPDMAVFNLAAITQLLIIGMAGIAVPVWMESKSGRRFYRLTAHLGLLGWFLSELSTLENGQAYVSVCWGIYAVALLIFGLAKEKDDIRKAAMGTIFLVVGKLFLVDLSQLQAIWRILLFIGFGALFLLISYYVQRRFLNEETTSDEVNETDI